MSKQSVHISFSQWLPSKRHRLEKAPKFNVMERRIRLNCAQPHFRCIISCCGTDSTLQGKGLVSLKSFWVMLSDVLK